MSGESKFKIDVSGVEKLQQAMERYSGDVEKEINDVLHGEAIPLMQDAIRMLIPVSGRKGWSGKKTTKAPPAKTSKSLTNKKSNLAITILTTKPYQYLYFPDDGSNTLNHRGNQHFFEKGGKSQENEIINRCIERLIKKIEG